MDNVSKFGIFTILLVSSLTIMVGAIIAPSLSEIVTHLKFGYAPSWLITLPALGVVVFAPLVGRLLNKFGVFKLLCMGLIPYGILGVAGAFIYNDYILILDRFLLGAATVTVQVSVTAYIAALFTGEDRMKLIAWQGMAIEFGGVVFLSIGGVLGEINWQFPFYLYLVAFICLVLVFRTLPKSMSVEHTSGAEVSQVATDKLKVKLIFYASLLAMMLFFIGFVTMPLYLPEAFGFEESETGYFMAFISVMAIVTASQMPKVVKLIGDGNTVALGFVFFTLGYFALASVVSLPLLILTAIFIGIGFGFTIPLLNHMMIEVSSLKDQGKNLSLFSMGIFGGQFLSTFIQYVSNDYTAVFYISAGLSILIAGGIYYMFRKYRIKE